MFPIGGGVYSWDHKNAWISQVITSVSAYIKNIRYITRAYIYLTLYIIIAISFKPTFQQWGELSHYTKLIVCTTFITIDWSKHSGLSEQMRWWAKVQYAFHTKWFTRRKTKIWIVTVGSWMCWPSRFRLLILFLYLFPFSRLCPEMLRLFLS